MSCLEYLAHFESPLPASQWLSIWAYKNTPNVSYVKLIEWLVVFVDVPYEVSYRNTVSVVFYLAFSNGNRTGTGNGRGVLVVFSLGSRPAVDTENRAKRLQHYNY